MRRLAAILVIMALAVLGALPAVAQDDVAPLQVIDADTEGTDVTVVIVAPDELLDVEIDDGSFLVTIDGVQRIPDIERLGGDELEVVLAIDRSGSMQGAAIDAAKVAAANFVDQMPAGTLFSVVGFGEEVEVVSDFTRDRAATIEAINGLVAGGETALYKGVVTAAAQFDPRSDASRNIVLLSDGGNTIDESSLGLAQSAVLASEATLYAIALQTDDTNIGELESMVADSGGEVTEVEDLDGLTALYDQFALTIRNQYRLSFEGAGQGTVEVFIGARVGGSVLSSAVVGVQMPLRAQPRPTATPIPQVTETRQTVAATAPATRTIDADDPQWMRWGASGALALAIGIFGYLALFPDKRRRNPLRDLSPVVAKAGADTARGIRRIPDMLTNVADRALSRSERGSSLTRFLEAGGLQMRNSEFVVLVALFGIIAFFLGAFVSFGFGITLAAIVVGVIFLILYVAVARRRDAFAKQLNGTLQLMAGSLRTGYSQAQVFDVVARESEAPTSEEFTRVVVEGRLGRDIVDSCRDMADRMDNEDFHWVTNAIEITGEIGGDLAEVLDNVAGTIRTRERIRRQTKALSAEGRISAAILAILPIPMFFWQYIVNREYTLLLFNTSLGRVIFIAAIAMLVIGVYWMSRLVKLKF